MTHGDLRYPLSRPDVRGEHPEYARLRAECPVAPVTGPLGPAWLVTRYADVHTVLTDARFSRARLFTDGDTAVTAQDDGGILLNTDPPEHDRLRRILAGRIGAAHVERVRPWAEDLAAGLVPALATTGPSNFLSAFADPFSRQVLGSYVARLAGVPERARDGFLHHTAELITLARLPMRRRTNAFAALRACLTELIEDHSRNPGDDAISAALAPASRDVDPPSADDLLAVLTNVLFGGHAAVVSALGYTLVAALAEPGLWERIRCEPGEVDRVVEEALRHTPPGDRAPLRVVTEDVQLGGVTLLEGGVVIPAIGSANRDPAAFDAPDEFRPDRSDARHLAFGRGTHACLGMALARMELRVALRVLSEALPHLRLATDVGSLRQTHAELTVSPAASIAVLSGPS